MSDVAGDSKVAHEYVLGHSSAELQRLQLQARLIDPITERIFLAAGLAPGMRVLEVGSGAGDVAFLVARLVGPTGEVVGVERVDAAVDTARARAGAQSLGNVDFRVGDPLGMKFDRPFDAVVGRYVLQFQKVPAQMLRKLADHARPGALVAFHELDWSGLSSSPAVPTFDCCCRWGLATLRAHQTEANMGCKLHATFLEAGFPAPSMRLEALLGGGPKSVDVLRLMAGITATLLPEMERFGVATAAEVRIATLFERMEKECLAAGSLLVGHLQVGAWSNSMGTAGIRT